MRDVRWMRARARVGTRRRRDAGREQKSGARFMSVPRSLFYCRESTVRIDIARLHRKRRTGTHQIKTGHPGISNR